MMKPKVHFADKYIINPSHPITVNLIGIGGTGSHVLTCLGRINHALINLNQTSLHVTAFDPDEVTEANIGRQLFPYSDIGLNKAEVLVTRINRFFGTSWNAVPEVYTNQKANITISCVDNIKSRIEIGNVLARLAGRKFEDYETPKYWLDFGNAANHGQYVLGTVGKIKQLSSKKYTPVAKMQTIIEMFDFTKIKDEDSGPSCSLSEALAKQDLFINSMLAEAGCSLLWKLLNQKIIDRQGAFFNLSTLQSSPICL